MKDENLIVGVAAKGPKLLAHFHHNFTVYLQTKYGLILKTTQKEETWIMPEIMPGCPIDLGVGAVLFAGEAAGFLNPMGEGISCGIESGHAAAIAALQYLDGNVEPLKVYQELVQPIHNYMVRQWRFVSSITNAFNQMV